MKLTKYSQLKHGMRVKCKVDGTRIDDGRISIDDDGKAYVCQNSIGGLGAKELFGYKYSWWLAEKYKDPDQWSDYVTDLESIEGIRAVKVGDIVIGRDGWERKVVEVWENSVLLGKFDDFEAAGFAYTFEELKRCNFKIKGQEEVEEELDDRKPEIVKLEKWLKRNQGLYPSAEDWRRALIKFIEGLIS